MYVNAGSATCGSRANRGTPQAGCTHGSAANASHRRWLGINARFTPSDTTVYPFRKTADPTDGSNLDASRHSCVLVRGKGRNSANRVVACDDLLASLT
jgi:hypothetical protein